MRVSNSKTYPHKALVQRRGLGQNALIGRFMLLSQGFGLEANAWNLVQNVTSIRPHCANTMIIRVIHLEAHPSCLARNRALIIRLVDASDCLELELQIPTHPRERE